MQHWIKYDVLMEEILARLHEIENEENVTIYYACESGSRAWGFPSEDSDYDVRFLYLRPRDWYLSIDVEEKRDVIERPISNILDISGWDLRKALKLLRKSNPPLLEWLNSPIVYQQKSTITEKIRELVPQYYSPVACLHHYLHMAQGNYREYLKGEIVWVKKYFYVLRPLLAINWIEKESDVVPMEFGVLVERCVKTPELKEAIENLLERKKRGHELDREPKIKIISDFVESELERLETKVMGSAPKPNTEILNELFRMALNEIG
ncbi:MAG TPA: nucleotidyltransferase domain-containing protein [Nitrososphaera sp.]|nr:nucleotidyltransferase domain-containing protein [Nitrososphaera sp.]